MVDIDETLININNFKTFLKEKGFNLNTEYKDLKFANSTFYDLGQHRLLALQKKMRK